MSAARRLIATAVVTGLVTGLGAVSTPRAGADATGGGITAPSSIWAGVSVYGGSYTGTRSSCTWALFPYSGLSGQEGGNPVDKTIDGVRYRLYLRTCGGVDTTVWIPDLPPRELSFDATAYLQQRLPDPVPSFAPPAGREVVKQAMWFWIARGAWSPVSVTAWVPTPSGVRWATTTARPVRLAFEPGDGGWGTGPVTCTGPGSVWTARLGDDAVSPSGCEYTYPHSSARAANGTSFAARISIVWDVSWRSSTGAGGHSGQLRTSAVRGLTVGEIEALVVP